MNRAIALRSGSLLLSPRLLWSRDTTAALSFGAVVATAAFFRFVPAGGGGIHLDEAQSIQMAARPDLFAATAADVHPPGYFLLLRAWMMATGTNLETLRLPSECAGVLSVAALYWLAGSLYGRRTALLAGLLGALSPFWIWQSQEVRMYSFLLLFTILSTAGLVMAVERRQKRGWILFAVASILGLYTQYFAALVLMAQTIFIGSRARRSPRLLVPAGLAVTAIMLSFAPWVMVLLHHYRGAGDPHLTGFTVYTPLALLTTFIFGYADPQESAQLLAAWPLLMLPALAAGKALVHLTWRGLILWLLVIVPSLVVFATWLLGKPAVSARYLIILTPAIYIALAWGVGHLLHRRFRALLTAVLATGMAAGWLVEEHDTANPAAEAYASVASYIDSHATTHDAIALDSDFNQFPYLSVARNNLPTYLLPPSRSNGSSVGNTSPVSYLDAIMAGRRSLYVLYYLEGNSPAGSSVRRYLDKNTAGHQVIVGSKYDRRNVPGQPASYIDVQLVRYDIIPRKITAPAIQRPLTLAQIRSLAGLSPNLTSPFAPAASAPGVSIPAFGTVTAPPRPLRAWRFTAAPAGGPLSSLILTNTDQFAITVTVRSGAMVKTYYLAARSELEIPSADFPAMSQPLAIRGSAPILAARDFNSGRNETLVYASRA